MVSVSSASPADNITKCASPYWSSLSVLRALLRSFCPTLAEASLESQLRGLIASSGAEVAVAFRTLDGRAECSSITDKLFHAASTMKVPVMIELFRQAHAGTLSLDDPLPIRNEFHSIVDGSAYTAERRRRFGQGGLRGGRQDA